jgi:hypothetical protein
VSLKQTQRFLKPLQSQWSQPIVKSVAVEVISQRPQQFAHLAQLENTPTRQGSPYVLHAMQACIQRLEIQVV